MGLFLGGLVLVVLVFYAVEFHRFATAITKQNAAMDKLLLDHSTMSMKLARLFEILTAVSHRLQEDKAQDPAPAPRAKRGPKKVAK